MKIHIDLKTKIIPENRNMYIARPGRGYRLYSQFLDAGHIGPEMPGIDLVNGKLFSKQEEIELRLKKNCCCQKVDSQQ